MIGQKIIHHESLDSTNNFTAKLLSEGTLAHGTVILADEQTSGRGQRGAVWLTEPKKNIIFSCYVEYANLSVEHQDAINHFVSLSICDTLQSFGIDASIKWPNDVLVRSDKIAGILIENQLERSLIKSSIIGIGLNVNQLEYEGLKATSMALEKDSAFHILEVVSLLIHYLNTHFSTLQQGHFLKLKQSYLAKLWLLNTRSFFEDEDGVFEGTILGTSPKGLLLIEKSTREVCEYDLKEIRFLERENDFQ
jgi:BirA family biotin operon repressor/biotin-[acetyl-CoA-carboxylase] ligase